MNDEKLIYSVLNRSKIIVIIGLSRDQEKDSYRVAKYLQNKGYRIIPVNPFAETILEEICYKNLLEIPNNIRNSINIIDIFRPSNEALKIVDQAITLKSKDRNPITIWFQLGIINEEAFEKSIKAGFNLVINRCIMIEHKRFFENIL
jgi:predicted CoA-binding protein